MHEFRRVLFKNFPPGAYYGDVYARQVSGSSVTFKDARVEDAAIGFSQDASLRYLTGKDGACRMAACDGWNAELLGSLIRQRPTRRRPVVKFSPVQTRIQRAEKPAQDVPLDEKIQFLESLDQAIRKNPGGRVRQVTLRWSDSRRKVIQWTSEGTACEEERCYASLNAHVLMEEGKIQSSAYETEASIGGWELAERSAREGIAQRVVQRAAAKLAARRAPAGEYPVVIASSAGGTFVHEAIGHSLEADAVQDGISPAYRSKMGKTVSLETVSIVDDPTLEGRYGSYCFDDEGVPSAPVRLVDKGVLSNYLYDRVTAAREKKTSNAHGRRDSSASRPLPRMSNIYIEPGKESPEGIIKSVANGMLVTKMGGGEVNTATGEFMFEVEEGFWITDGVARHMVRDANISGVAADALASIERVGSDLGWSVGVCGKEGQSVPVSDGMPTVLIRRLLVGGLHG